MSRTARVGMLLAAALPAGAQEVEHRIGTYKAATSYEFGYRSAFVDGNREVYRSAVNYGNGLRLFEGMFRLNSGDGHGRWVDELVFTSSGAGGDPYQSSSLRLEKNRFYRFDLGFRIVNYYNQLAALSGGEHRFNTERIMQSYDLTLFPQRRVQLLVGFDRNNQSGPALSSQNIDVRGEPAFPRDRFLVYADDVRRLNNTWRAGANASAGPVKISFLQGWDVYKEDTRHFGAGRRRDDPVHGLTPFSRLNVHTDAGQRFGINARLVYAGGERNFALDENLAALNPASGVVVTRQAFVLGRGRRAQGTGDLTLTFQPGGKWALANTTSVNQSRITGHSAFVEVRTPANRLDPDRNEHFFSLLAIRRISNSTDVNFRPSKRVGFYGGYHYAIRRIQSRENLQEPGEPPFEQPLYSFENSAHSGLAGIRVRPLPSLTALIDLEYGRADQPFTPLSEKRFHAETVKAAWKHKAWQVSAGFQAYRNRNSVPPVLGALEGGGAHNYQSRQYRVGLDWTPAKRYAFEAGYAKTGLETASGILNFPLPGAAEAAARRSLYVSNVNHAHATLRVELPRDAALFLGYSIVKDTADGRDRPSILSPFAAGYPNFSFDGTDLINVYPLSYQAPQARLSFRLHKKLWWNLGWQYYGYSEKFTGLQDYSAHVATTSLRWAF